MEYKEYECENCGKRAKNKDNVEPECCGKKMKQLPLDVCTTAADAEFSRPMDSDEPCDDGRAG
jgi:hypothetical protein